MGDLSGGEVRQGNGWLGDGDGWPGNYSQRLDQGNRARETEMEGDAHSLARSPVGPQVRPALPVRSTVEAIPSCSFHIHVRVCHLLPVFTFELISLLNEAVRVDPANLMGIFLGVVQRPLPVKEELE